jgi:putative phosphoribosyl transferase
MSQGTDESRIEPVEIPPLGLDGLLGLPATRPLGVVIFAHGSGSSRLSPRNQFVAAALRDAGLATLLFDLLRVKESSDRRNVFDIDLLAHRLVEATNWIRSLAATATLPVGYFGASTGAAAALRAAAQTGNDVAAIVSRGGRPDLAGQSLRTITAPTLLIVGGDDPDVLELNRQALSELTCEAKLAIVPGATHLFDEPGTLEAVVDLAGRWFLTHLPPQC